MAPSRGKGKARATPSRSTADPTTRRTTSATRKPKNDTPDVYQDMLAEAAVTDHDEVSDRPPKRRRVATSVTLPSPGPLWNYKGKQTAPANETSPETPGGKASRSKEQTIEASDSDSEESEFSFEDVDLNQPATSADDPAITSISIPLNPPTIPTHQHQRKPHRKPASLVEKAHRLLVHKAHLLCLLGHCVYINAWCNDEKVHRNLEGLLTEKTKVYWKGREGESQFDRNRMFLEGLKMAVEVWRGRFRVVGEGMRRARWDVEGKDEGAKVDVRPMDRAEFIAASRKLEGSQATGNQLFCALLRSVGVEARVVCSLQVLPFGNAPAKSTPQKRVKRTVFASHSASNTDHNASEASADDLSVKSSVGIGKVPAVRRRLGQPGFAPPLSVPANPPLPTEKQHHPIRKLTYPIFWTEAFNPAHQRWLPLDPVVTGTLNKPAKLEPPSSYELCQLSYAIALEADGVARDVTRRYARAYNAKTRRLRVESTENGGPWLKKAMRSLRRRGAPLDREQVEDAELAQKEAREGLPSNVQDFKGHPYYALERHLRRHEVIFPRREVGRVNAGTAARPRMEGVYRRGDVVVCRSGEKWYRMGREVKAGEQALKHVPARRTGRAKSPAGDEDGDAEEVRRTALYAHHQTEPYIPPPVRNGRIPRNAFGNLDIYTPSMVPSGGTLIRHPLAQAAARQLRVDYADAVTGFTFKGRQGTAVVEGVVVAEEFADAVRAVIRALEVEGEEERGRGRSLVALTMWGRLVKGLRIRERVRRYARGAENGGETETGDGDVAVDAGLGRGGEGDKGPLITAGKYTIEELVAPAKCASRKKRVREESEEEGGFEHEDTEEGVETEAPAPASVGRSLRSRRRVVYDDDDEGEEEGHVPGTDGAADEGGGFLADDAVGDDGGGGGVSVVDREAEDVDGAGGFATEDDRVNRTGGGFLPDDGVGGGFLPDSASDEAGGGGFLPDAAGHGDDSGGLSHSGGPLPGVSGLPPHAQIPWDEHASDGEAESERAVPSEQRTSAIPLSHPGHLDDGDLHDHHATLIRDSVHGQGAEHPSNGPDVAVAGDDCHTGIATDLHHGASGIQALHQNASETVAQSTWDEGLVEQDDGQESDRGSLLSHDPEDEGAEPDWLESD